MREALTALLCSPASHLPAKSQGAAAPVTALVGRESPVVFKDRGGLVQVRVAPPGPLEKGVLCPFADPVTPPAPESNKNSSSVYVSHQGKGARGVPVNLMIKWLPQWPFSHSFTMTSESEAWASSACFMPALFSFTATPRASSFLSRTSFGSCCSRSSASPLVAT